MPLKMKTNQSFNRNTIKLAFCYYCGTTNFLREKNNKWTEHT